MRSLLLIIIIAVISMTYFPDYVKADEDNYEPNDGYYEAYDINSNAGKWLSEIDGLGYQNDQDWYEINLSHERLVVYIKGTINIALSKAGDPHNYIYDQSDFNNGMLDIASISSGIWYIRITGSNDGNWYNLYWDNIVWNHEDHYENNDNYGQAYDLSSYEDTWLSEIDSLGISFDDDWYKFTADPYNLHIKIDLRFVHSHSDLDLELYDIDGSTMLDHSYSSTNNENIDYILFEPGTYYIRVWGDETHSIYDLKWEELPYLWDDNYEQNDWRLDAYVIAENQWLSNIDGLGKQSDDDWYECNIITPDLVLDIDCTFTHADGNINIALYDDMGTLLVESTSTTNNEYIDYEIDHLHTYKTDRFYIKVYGDDNMNDYNLRWNGVPPSDDNYEENDEFNNVFDLSSHENTWLTEIDGEGITLDEDWYRIYVDPAKRELLVNCTFEDDYGNINLAIYDDSETLIIQNASTTDNEHINYVLPSGGSYYIKIYGEIVIFPDIVYPNRYDLKWNTFIPTGDNPEITNAPDDMIVESGYSGVSISWTATDENPSTYEIELQGSGVVAGPTAWLSGVAITYAVPDGLAVGEYFYTVNFTDDYEQFITDTVKLTIQDTEVPVITSAPSDIIVGLSYTGASISWTAIDPNPNTYKIDLQGSGVVAGPTAWSSGVAIIYNVPNGLSIGEYLYTVNFTDDYNSFMTDTVKFTVQDMDPVITSAPSDFEIESDYTGVSILWTATDSNPNTYEVELQGIGIVAGPTAWSSGVAITYIISDGLAAGDYFYTVNFTDDDGNFVIDTVKITVKEDTPVADDPQIPFGNWYLFFLGISITALVLIQKRRK